MAERWPVRVPAFPALSAAGEVSEVGWTGIATVIVRAGQERALAAKLRELFGLDLPTGPRRAASGAVAFLGVGRGRWLAAGDVPGLVADLTAAISGLAAVVDQSGAYGVLRLSGDHAASVLARAVPVDLNPAAFPEGGVATTLIEQIGVTVAKVAAAPPAFELFVARSYAAGFGRWLAEALA